mmetsp:Transcript_12593/g.32993  ORF Transcript_12593/g.32993 Transcript_12593/m.32993 type:complete len:287 (+) Transcript_12593:82-942(+)
MAAAALKSATRLMGGTLKRLTHYSEVCKCEMTFAVFLPPQAKEQPMPALYWLSGLTCTDENFSQKSGFARAAAARGLAIVLPDTSPRGVTIEGADDSYDFGSGAGFYVDATEVKWAGHYHMYSYVTSELPSVVAATFPDELSGKKAISGHSMGGHGALTLYLKNPGMYASVSAFSPICHPTNCPWGVKAFTGYLGSTDAGKPHDAVELINAYDGAPFPILVDQGAADNFLVGDVNQLQPEALKAACAAKGLPLDMRMQEGYDHSYFFISSFIDDHINFHADALAKA